MNRQFGILLVALVSLGCYAQDAITGATQRVATSSARTLAFPTAEGFGKYASGGRGGKVVEVTNLNNDGEGSLRWALTEAGRENATIVFRVSGIIDVGPNPTRKNENAIRAKLKNVTIAGQTAPGEGILLRGGKLNLGGSENVIIRNIRGRLGTKVLPREAGETDEAYKKRCFIDGGAIGIENATNIIIDHCCFGWSGEENITMYDNHFTTVQWCIVHEGLRSAGHKKGERGYGCQWGGSPATFHHNLLIHNDSRSARINGATNPSQDRNVFLEYVNNVNYNWGRQNSCYGGENEAGPLSSHECNFVGNYYKPGPATPRENLQFTEMSQARKGKTLTSPSLWYLADNIMEGDKEATRDNWRAISNKTGFSQAEMQQTSWLYPSASYTREPFAQIADYDLYRTPAESAKKAYHHVLEKVGTIHRDVVEQRLVREAKTGTTTYKGLAFMGKNGQLQAPKPGIIDSPANAEGWPEYRPATPVVDNDHDGMDDAWERKHGLNPNDPEDRNTVISKEGYTALEVYLNSLMGE